MATPIQISPTQDNKSKLWKPPQPQQISSVNFNDDFYHIKPCYQSVPQTKPSRCTSSCVTNAPSRHHHFTSTALPSCLLLQQQFTTNIGGALLWRRRRHRLIVASLLLFYMATMSTTMAAPQSCVLCDKNDLIAKDPHGNYEEFLFEHQVTRQDAINALKQLNASFYEGSQSDSSCNALTCTEKVNKYCLGPQFINDHCWCEFGHSTEGLPFVPHICYVGEKVYTPSVGSCFFYEEVKECCCSSLLAKQWRHISSASSLQRNSTMFCSYFVLVITLLNLLIRRLHF